jgi:predicted Zn-dependent peptidase
VTIQMMVRAGSIHETEKTHGLSRLVETVSFHSSRDYQDIQKEIDSYGGQYRSGTYPDFVYYAVTIEKEYVPQMLSIFTDFFQNPVFAKSSLAEAKTVLLERRQSEKTNLRFQLLELFLKQTFTVHPYRFLHLGNEENIRNFDTREVQDYFENHYLPERMTLVIVGDIDGAETSRYVMDRFGSFMRTPQVVDTWEKEPLQNQPRKIVQKHTLDEEIAIVTLGWLAPSIQNPETYSMDVLISTMGIGQSTRLQNQIQNQMGSVYAIWAEYMTPREPGYCMFTAVCDPSVVKEVQEKILREVDILRMDSITPMELKKAITYLKTHEAYSHQETMGTAFYLGYWSVVQDFDFSQTYLQNVVKVSVADVQDVAKKYLKSDNYTSVVLLPKIQIRRVKK